MNAMSALTLTAYLKCLRPGLLPVLFTQHGINAHPSQPLSRWRDRLTSYLLSPEWEERTMQGSQSVVGLAYPQVKAI